MELVKTDATGRELGYVIGARIDFEIGAEPESINDFEVEIKRWDWDGSITHESRLFVPDTEYGGIVREIYTSTAANTIQAKGYTWRGMMEKKIIQPEVGQDYATATGDINAIVKGRIEKEFPGLFYGEPEPAGVTVANYQFDRYCTLHDGLKKMLASVGHRLDIRYREGERGAAGYVKVKAVPINDLSERYEMSNDDNMDFTSKDNRRGVNHLICLGKGELKDRTVVHLYVDKDGKISQTQTYTGAEEITEIYDSNGSEREDLIKSGTEKLETKKNSMTYDMTMTKLEGLVDLGDIVGGRDELTKIRMSKPIGRKIWTVSEGEEKIEYKLEGEN